MKLLENNQRKKYTHCAKCGGLLKDSYFTFAEADLQGTIFYELDGSDILKLS
jgi:hypothetical protein